MKRKEAVTIGTELKKILEQTGMTSYRLSQELGMGQSYLSRLFKNKFNPSYGLVKKIAKMLDYDLQLVKVQRKKK
jgi:transcriptional regulator with XRE-family HTH domain